MSWFSDLAPALGTAAGFAIGGPVGAMIGGSLGAGISSASSAKDAVKMQQSINDQNVSLQREQMSWEENLANTAHQREVADLKAAGLNPILSVNKGAATPVVAPAHVDSSSANILQGNRNAIEAQLNTMSTMQQIKLAKTQQVVNSAVAVKTGEEARRQALENDYLEYQTQKRRFEEKRRSSRPDWLKGIGVDVRDTLDTVNLLKGFVKWSPN